MTTIIINDKLVEAVPGEGLLSAARRNRAHIGFVCDGNGLCTTCECRILAGQENLSTPNAVERNWLSAGRLRQGYRLACQTTFSGNGPVQILTRAEELRRLWRNVTNPPAGTDPDLHWRRFIGSLVAVNMEQLNNFPWNVARSVARLGLVRTILPVRNNSRYFRDIGRIIDERTDNAFAQY